MNRRFILKTSLAGALATLLAQHVGAQTMDETSQASFDTVMAFMAAMGEGPDAMSPLMADDMVWHNEGDKSIPWVHGGIQGKEAIFDFLGVFGAGLQTTKWENTDAFASGDTVAVFGVMNGITAASGKEIGEFSFALRAKVRDGQVVLWHWFEDSFALSQAYHAASLSLLHLNPRMRAQSRSTQDGVARRCVPRARPPFTPSHLWPKRVSQKDRP
ncbi:MAG: nuclear transport factor 2 family protein [Pseudomonadota bacterium]